MVNGDKGHGENRHVQNYSERGGIGSKPTATYRAENLAWKVPIALRQSLHANFRGSNPSMLSGFTKYSRPTVPTVVGVLYDTVPGRST